jgi:hypothetical protein
MIEIIMNSAVIEHKEPLSVDSEGSLADLFLAANQELARSDARIYRSVDRHLKKVREILNSAEDFGSGSEAVPLLPQSDFSGVEPSFYRQTRQSLQKICREHGVTGFHRMTKDQMIEELIGRDVPAPSVPLEALTKGELIQLLRQQGTR